MASKLLKQGYSSRKRQTNFRNVYRRIWTCLWTTYTETLITKFTLLYHVYVEGCDHQM